MINVILAEDHTTVREGLKILVNGQSDMRVVAEAGDGRAAIEAVRAKRPDVVVMDITMPHMNGLRATRQLRSEFPALKILTLTRHTDETYLEQLLAAGADGFVLKQSAPAELIDAIRKVGKGGSYLDTTLTNSVMGRLIAGHRGSANTDLSPRELSVIRMFAWGYGIKEIATKLEVSTKTVEIAKSAAMRKLKLKNRTDVVRYALTQGWLDED